MMALTQWDDYFIHQTGDTIDTVADISEHFMDRCWFGCHGQDGRTYIAAGLGTYPNASGHGIIDGSFCVIRDGVQHNFRASRHISHEGNETDRSNSTVGPLSIEIIEPMKRQRFTLGENPHGLSGSIDFTARAAPFLYNKLDVPSHPVTHFTQMGYFDGSITIGDETIKLNRYVGVRDRSWGVRGKGLMRHVEAYFWIMGHFDNCSLNFTFFHVPVADNDFLLADGAIMHDDGRETRLVKARHRSHFDEDTTAPGSTRLWSRAEWEFTDEHGKIWTLEAKGIQMPFYSAGNGYDDRHGLDRGPLLVEGESWDFNQPDTLKSLRRSGDDDRWHFDIHDRLAELTLDGVKGVGLVNNVCGSREGWAYVPTLVD
ncbi:hypothetical protein WG907_16555 [Sphingobium sp. AN558]|uniref:hypothetical protein n=1 Tax=Sphingobium sp. AN558 TaxID=3133442 RepID=UPI0030BFF78A